MVVYKKAEVVNKAKNKLKKKQNKKREFYKIIRNHSNII